MHGESHPTAGSDSESPVQVEVLRVIDAIRNGRLDTRADASRFAGGWGELVSGVNDMLDAVLLPIKEGTSVLDTIAQQISLASQSLAEGASEQAANLEQIAASLEEVSSMTRQNAASAEELASATEQTAEQVAALRELVERFKLDGAPSRMPFRSTGGTTSRSPRARRPGPAPAPARRPATVRAPAVAEREFPLDRDDDFAAF